jgi:hypothetical protein
MRRTRARSPTRYGWWLLALLLTISAACGGAEPATQPTNVQPATVQVEVYFTNDTLGDPCTDVFGVTRTIDRDDILTGTLNALLAGPTPTEIDDGYGGWFGPTTANALLDAHLDENGTVHVTFTDLRELIPNASTSCGSTALLAMLDTTLLALDDITGTRYALADQTAFYAWLQRDDPDTPPAEEITQPEQPTEPVEPDAQERDDEPAAPALEESISLRPDGLGIVAFGTPADQALAALEGLIGSPPAGECDRADWVVYREWPDLGLAIGVSLPGWEQYDGVSRFVGWVYSGAASGPLLTTPEGVTVGTTLAELRAAYGDALVVHDDEPYCDGGSWSFNVLRPGTDDLALTGFFGEPPTEDSEVGMLRVGLSPGC